MKVTVFGASGKVGRLLTTELLDKGYDVTAFVHSNKLDIQGKPRLKIITGDIHNPADVARAIYGSDAVVCALGSWGSKKKDIVCASTVNIVPAMEEAGIKRFVSVTGAVAKLPAEKFTFIQLAGRLMFGRFALPILLDAEQHLKILQQSHLSWTVLRSPPMTNKDTKIYHLSLSSPAPWASISRYGVAKAMVDLIEKDTFICEAPYISAK